MAGFKQAYLLTEHTEGLYANSPNDRGGETFCGIASKFWPQWPGWAIIDSIKQTYGINANTINLWAKKSEPLQLLIASFYKQNFWDVNKLDFINDQQLANNIYDFGVNSGVNKAAKSLQSVVGVTVDGIIGNITIAAVNKANAKNIYTLYNVARTAFYHKIAVNPGQLQYLPSWMSRIKPYIV